MIELICGYLGRSGAPDSLGVTRRMADGLRFGRPAAVTFWSSGSVALGRVALASGPSQPGEPVIHVNGSFSVTADLRLPGHEDDAAAHDLVFRALAEGRFPQALDGDFALAMWNAEREVLTLARDRVGIRPLFYANTGNGDVAFASFPEALIAGGIVAGRYRAEFMAETAFAGPRASEQSWIEGLRRVPPGHALTIGREGRSLDRYWRYPVSLPEAADDHAAAAQRLRAEIEAAVVRALPRHGPVFTLLSGGLDSGAVTALAGRLCGAGPENVNAFCLSMPESHRVTGALDETPMARQVASQAGVRLREVPMNTVREALFAPLSPTIPLSADPGYPYRRVLRQAAEGGADRVLCGFGGDEVASFNGQGALLADFLALRWRALRRTARELSTRVWRGLLSQAAAELLPPALDRRLRQLLLPRTRHLSLAERAIRPAFRPRDEWLPRPSIGTARVQRRRLEGGGFRYRLEEQAWEAAHEGMRFVFPLLDWRLLEVAAALPGRLQLHGGMRRALFRTAVADLLPPEILGRASKLNPAPATLYQLALDRDALIAEARRVARSPMATAVFDLGEIERQLTMLPAPEDVVEAIRAHAAEGTQYRDPRTTVLRTLKAARALAENEAACRRNGDVRPEAA